MGLPRAVGEHRAERTIALDAPVGCIGSRSSTIRWSGRKAGGPWLRVLTPRKFTSCAFDLPTEPLVIEKQSLVHRVTLRCAGGCIKHRGSSLFSRVQILDKASQAFDEIVQLRGVEYGQRVCNEVVELSAIKLAASFGFVRLHSQWISKHR